MAAAGDEAVGASVTRDVVSITSVASFNALYNA